MIPVLGEIRIFGGRSIPQGWAICDGSLVSITENEVLYTLLGVTYGGDGITTFGLPDLRGRVMMNQGRSGTGTTYILGAKTGAERVALAEADLPAHQHTFSVSSQSGITTLASNNFLAAPEDPTENKKAMYFYAPADKSGLVVRSLASDSLTRSGGSAAHENRMPFLTISYMIATQGIFPDLTDL